MTIEAIQTLTNEAFANGFLNLMYAAKNLVKTGGTIDYATAGFVEKIDIFRQEAVLEGTSAKWFPALDMVEAICIQEGFDVIKYRREHA
ncbi:hypothetical protein ABUE34_12835 [Kozakia baliensis]|uniref:hypothetical protein n=1 Tax=Kozakia baliensis TaxID=153496 RepID=UPI00345B4D08